MRCRQCVLQRTDELLLLTQRGGCNVGIALGLGDEGAKVYVTGRSKEDLVSTAKEVTARGGHGIPLVVDHSNAAEIKGLFETIAKNEGQLHLLVNNCYSAAGARDFVMARCPLAV